MAIGFLRDNIKPVGKISEFLNSKKYHVNKKDKEKSISFFQLLRFSDFIDKILLVIGTISAIASGAIYQLIFLFYGQVTGVLVDYQTYKQGNTNQTDKSDKVQECLIRKTATVENFNEKLDHNIRLYVIIGFCAVFVHYLACVCWNTACERQIKRMRNAIYKSILRQDMSFFDKSSSGELNSVLIGNIDIIKSSINFKFADFIILTIRGIGCIILSLALAWKFSIVFVAMVPFMVVSTVLMIFVIKKYSVEEFKSYGNSGRIAQEVLSSLRTVYAFGMERKWIETYSKSLQGAEAMAKKKGLLTGIFGSFSTGTFNFLFAVGIYYAIYLLQSDCYAYSPSKLVPSFFCIVAAGFALGQAFPYLKDLAEAKGAAKRVFEIIDRKSAIDVFDKAGKILPNLVGDVEFENVFFSYPQRAEAKILKGLNLRIPGGKTVALVGSSGGGKSTVVALLERFYLPTLGSIRIDGCPIEQLDLNWLRNQIALVSQEPILFSTSIRENIRLGRLDATDAEVEEAAKNANVHNFISGLTHGYDTLVGERGAHLSGGQKQRIAIARALVRNPRILLLDEATSALDYESERTVQEALDRAKIGRTTIIIAHRLSTIRNADLIVYLASGQQKEMGTHDELMERKGLYYELVVAQSSNKEEPREEKEANESISLESEDENEDLDEEEEESEIDDSTTPSNEVELKTSTRRIKKRRKMRVKFPKKRPPFMYEKKLIRFHKPETLWLIAGSLGQCINGASFPVISVIFCEIYTLFSLSDKEKQTEMSIRYMIVLMAIAVVNLAAQILYSYAFALCGCRLTTRLRKTMFEALLRQEIAFHDQDENKSSVLATQLANNTGVCRGLTSDKISLLAQGFSGIGLSIVISFALSWQLTLVMLLFVPLTFISGNLLGKASTSHKTKGKSNVEDELGRLTVETVENIKTLVSLSREKYFIDEFATVNKHKFRQTLAFFHFHGVLYGMSNCMLFFIQATAFSFGFYLMQNYDLALANVFRVYATITFSSMTLGRVYSLMPDQKRSISAAKSVFRIVDRKSKIDSLSEQGLRPEKVHGNIRFENVFFNYPNRPDVKILQDFNLEVHENETNALVGPSGCGKSTTIALLLRFYDADSGTIYLDGVDIRKLNIRWLRSKIGLVSQEPTLFNMSIYENICYGDLERQKIDLNEVIQVAIQSNIHEKILSLPEKYETIVGSKGGQLSGGEKQRVAIARALIRQPKILLLDEATSALDTASEQVVQDALDRAQIGRTCIVIAHRLSTIKNSSKISVVKDGKLLEEGTHSELMDKRNFYYKLQSNYLYYSK